MPSVTDLLQLGAPGLPRALIDRRERLVAVAVTANQASLEIEEHRLAFALDADIESIGSSPSTSQGWASRVSRRCGCSIRPSTGHRLLACASSAKYSRVCKWILIPGRTAPG